VRAEAVSLLCFSSGRATERSLDWGPWKLYGKLPEFGGREREVGAAQGRNLPRRPGSTCSRLHEGISEARGRSDPFTPGSNYRL